MPVEKYDVVVIGAGLGGLSAAAYLAQAGKRVLVLEHHSVPGGYAHEFRRGHYRFEVALHALDGAGPGGWSYPILKDLGVMPRVKFHRLDPFYTTRFPGGEITAHADPLAYETELIRQFPGQASGIRALFDAMLRSYFDVRRFMADGELKRRPPMEQIPSAYPHMLGPMSQSWGDFMSQYVDDPAAQGVLSTLWGYYGLPPSMLNAATFIFPWVSYHLFGAYYPEGGSMAISRAIERTIQAHGGEIRYRQTVNHIIIEEGKAVAVETEKGLRVEAGVVVSNANAPDTLLKFVGRQYLPAGYVDKVENAAPSLSNLVVYLGLERDLRGEGWDYHELFIAETYDVEADYRAVKQGDFEKAGMVITNYTHVDPACAPQGSSVVALMTLAPWDYANQWGTHGKMDHYGQNPQYQELKQDAGEKLVKRAERHLPGLRAATKYMEVATPLTNYRYSLNPGGAIYGSEQTVENMYIGRLNEKTPIPNLFLTGAWVTGGGMSAAMLSGRSTAHTVLAHMEKTNISPMMGVEIPLEDEVNTDRESSSQLTTPIQSSNPPGQAPKVTLTATGSGRKIDLRRTGNLTLLVCHGQETAAEATQVHTAVRQKYPLSSTVLVASLVNLKIVPRLFRGIAETAMRKAYQDAAASLNKGSQPAEYVIILPDWDGSVTASLGLRNTNHTAGVVVLDGSGNLLGTYQGDNLASTAIQLLEKNGT